MGLVSTRPALPLSPNPHVAFGQDLAQRCEFSGIAAEEAKVDADTSATSPSVSVCLGAYLQWAFICDGLREDGVAFSITPPSQVAVRHFHALGVAELLQAGTVLKAAIKGAMAAGYSWHTSMPKAAAQDGAKSEPPAPVPQEIRIVGMPPVSIASLPERATETTINRDAGGEMTGSTAVETDRAKT